MRNRIPRGEDGQDSGFIDTFPSLGATRERVIGICETPRTNPSDLNRVIHLDPVLFAKTQFVYKSFFPRHKAEYVSVAKVITVLHINTIRNYVRQSALEARRPAGADTRAAFAAFKRAVARAFAARFLAGERGEPEEKLQQYYAAGLLYGFAAMASPAGRKIPAEEIARMWGLTGALADVARCRDGREDYDGARKDLVWTAAAADYCAARICGGGAGGPPAAVFDYLRLDERRSRAASSAAKAALKSQIAFIKGGR